MTASGRDFRRFETDEVRLKFWLPDRLDQVLTDLQQTMAVSRSTLVRMTLFQHLYGRYDYIAMQVLKLGFFAPRAGSNVMFSRQSSSKRAAAPDNPSTVASSPPVTAAGVPRGGRTPELRKNQCDVTVHLPLCMKDDLVTSASRLGIPLSVHVREILISQLLGREYLPDRESFMIREPAGHEACLEALKLPENDDSLPG